MFVHSEGIRFEGMSFSVSNFAIITENSTIVAFWNSIKFAVLTTALCAFFGYLVAYCLYQSKLKNKYMILLLLILPSWTNFLLRINALASVFKPNNILQDIFNLPAVGEGIIGTDWAVLLGMVFTYLPILIMPIYTSLE
jgi:spermidine/putrescine transport system permease protein